MQGQRWLRWWRCWPGHPWLPPGTRVRPAACPGSGTRSLGRSLEPGWFRTGQFSARWCWLLRTRPPWCPICRQEQDQTWGNDSCGALQRQTNCFIIYRRKSCLEKWNGFLMKEFIESATLSWLNIDQISDIPGSWLNAIHSQFTVTSAVLHSPSMTVCTCLTMISLAMAAGQSSTMCFTLSLSWVSSCRMKSSASSAVFIFLAVWIENVGEPNASCQMKVLISFLMTKVINLI